MRSRKAKKERRLAEQGTQAARTTRNRLIITAAVLGSYVAWQAADLWFNSAPKPAQPSVHYGGKKLPSQRNQAMRIAPPEFNFRNFDFGSLPVYYRDARRGETIAYNAAFQRILGDALLELHNCPMLHKVGTPKFLEVFLTEVKEDHDYLTQTPAAFEEHRRDVEALLAFTRNRLAGIDRVYMPLLKMEIATADNVPTGETNFKEFLTRNITMYVLGKNDLVYKGTVSLHGTTREVVNVDVTQPDSKMGDVRKTGTVTYDGKELRPTLSYGALTTTWSANDPSSLDNVLAEYLHVSMGPLTVQHGSHIMAQWLARHGDPKTPKMPWPYPDMNELWTDCYRHYDMLEEALVHATAHTLTNEYLKEQGKPAATYCANYIGGKELEARCQKAGVDAVIREYGTDPDSLFRISGIKHRVKE